ncbi:hypothetical protein [Pseudonocardia sp. EV170527-09]|uniref:hypothetical protein n=1 Tax=Pseudonocardia sp. EV170527-09 TaxID=2603411 RepID=UPI001386D932|nr:hypothetical protein [Pseudonocardia sp. EV170527-09]
MTAAPAPCTHLGAHVVAHLGSHEPLPWQPVPAPAAPMISMVRTRSLPGPAT